MDRHSLLVEKYFIKIGVFIAVSKGRRRYKFTFPLTCFMFTNAFNLTNIVLMPFKSQISPKNPKRKLNKKTIARKTTKEVDGTFASNVLHPKSSIDEIEEEVIKVENGPIVLGDVQADLVVETEGSTTQADVVSREAIPQVEVQVKGNKKNQRATVALKAPHFGCASDQFCKP
ncbi:hypothetical protein QYF36_026973 [Acer negundo]|nr:hypothetical protein QYF36_026973 [Acer negundo]